MTDSVAGGGQEEAAGGLGAAGRGHSGAGLHGSPTCQEGRVTPESETTHPPTCPDGVRTEDRPGSKALAPWQSTPSRLDGKVFLPSVPAKQLPSGLGTARLHRQPPVLSVHLPEDKCTTTIPPAVGSRTPHKASSVIGQAPIYMSLASGLPSTKLPGPATSGRWSLLMT